MKASFGSLYFFFFVLSLFTFQTVLAQDHPAPPNDWYCDLRRNMNLSAGKVISITPYVKSGTEVPRYDGYRMVEIVEFYIFDINTDEMEPEVKKFMNVAGRGDSEYGFTVGEKYLFESARNQSQVTSDAGYYFIRPSDYVRPFAEAGELLDFLRSIKGHNEYEEVLGVNRGTPVHKSVPVDKNHHVARLVLSDEFKRSHTQGSARVLTLLDESGNIIKAKAVCVTEPGFAEAAEKAALASSFSPFVVNGKPVKSVKTMVYYFTIY